MVLCSSRRVAFLRCCFCRSVSPGLNSRVVHELMQVGACGARHAYATCPGAADLSVGPAVFVSDLALWIFPIALCIFALKYVLLSIVVLACCLPPFCWLLCRVPLLLLQCVFPPFSSCGPVGSRVGMWQALQLPRKSQHLFVNGRS